MLSNDKLRKSWETRNNEFYTRLGTIEVEIDNYWAELRGKVVYCPCDSEESKFVQYFKAHFDEIGLKSLVYSHYTPLDRAWLNHYDGSDTWSVQVESFGSCLDSVAWEVMQQDDIVVITNPPFSSWRRFIDLVMDAHAEFIILGGAVNLGYCNAREYYKDGRLHLGYHYNTPIYYDTPTGERGVNSGWFTSFEVDKTMLPFFSSGVLYESVKSRLTFYDSGDRYLYLKRAKDLPDDYTEPFAAPLSFLAKVNPLQFKFIDFIPQYHSTVSGRKVFSRVLLQRLERND